MCAGGGGVILYEGKTEWNEEINRPCRSLVNVQVMMRETKWENDIYAQELKSS